ADTVLMTSQRMSEYLDTVAASVPAEASVALRQQLSEFPAVDRLPSWEEMIVARNGKIWLSADVTMRLPPELSGPVNARRWVVLDPEGRPSAEATTPAGFTLRDVSADRAVGLYADELGVQSIVLYAVEPYSP